LNVASFELPALLAECAGQLATPVTVHADAAPASFTGDRRLLARALGNILRNAEKYAQSRIALRARRIGQQLEITVDDDGPGIPPAEREAVFEPFYRLDRSRDRSTGGFGLGLAIARKAVVLHGGSLSAAASSLGGARFVLLLPLP
jgi:two-component system OmpR family sensor kinase